MEYISQSTATNTSILDYGCGEGTMVISGLKNNLNIYGTDVFYGGSNSSKNKVTESGLYNKKIFEIKNNKIPFPDSHFDLVISNQVFEHVESLDDTLKEISRVLKNKGILISTFTPKESFLEDHCGIPFLHWFKPSSKIRFYYALLIRLLGFGHFKQNKSPKQWVSDFLTWLDKYTYYRTKLEISETFSKYFSINQSIKDKFLLFVIAKHKIPLLGNLVKHTFIKHIANNFENIILLSKKN